MSHPKSEKLPALWQGNSRHLCKLVVHKRRRASYFCWCKGNFAHVPLITRSLRINIVYYLWNKVPLFEPVESSLTDCTGTPTLLISLCEIIPRFNCYENSVVSASAGAHLRQIIVTLIMCFVVWRSGKSVVPECSRIILITTIDWFYRRNEFEAS